MLLGFEAVDFHVHVGMKYLHTILRIKWEFCRSISQTLFQNLQQSLHSFFFLKYICKTLGSNLSISVYDSSFSTSLLYYQHLYKNCYSRNLAGSKHIINIGQIRTHSKLILFGFKAWYYCLKFRRSSRRAVAGYEGREFFQYVCKPQVRQLIAVKFGRYEFKGLAYLSFAVAQS